MNTYLLHTIVIKKQDEFACETKKKLYLFLPNQFHYGNDCCNPRNS